jgi:hypothetical protein
MGALTALIVGIPEAFAGGGDFALQGIVEVHARTRAVFRLRERETRDKNAGCDEQRTGQFHLNFLWSVEGPCFVGVSVTRDMVYFICRE